jgi:hypothetical protein
MAKRDIGAYIEAEKRGLLSPDQQAWLGEMRKRGLAPGYDFEALEMVKNIPGSAVDFAADMYNAVRHPIETAKAVGNVGLGVMQKAIPGEQPQEIYADQAWDFIKSRYGSGDGFQRALEQDPVGVLADFASAATGAGAAVRGGATIAAKVPGMTGVSNVARQVGDAAATVGKVVDPMNIAVNSAKVVGGKAKAGALNILSKDPVADYKSAAMFRPSLGPKKQEQLAETALKEDVSMDMKGVQKVDQGIADAGFYIDDLISLYDASGVRIPVSSVLDDMGDLEKKLGGFKFNAPGNLQVAREKIKNFKIYLKESGIKDVSPSEMQLFKKDLYKDIDFDRSNLKSVRAVEALSKTLGKNAKQQLERVDAELRESGFIDPDAHPVTLKDANARQGSLLGLLPELERATARVGNRNKIGLDQAVKLGAGAAGGKPGLIIGSVQGFLERPLIKARIARYKYHLRQKGISEQMIQDRWVPAMVRQLAFEASKAEQEGLAKEPLKIPIYYNRKGGQ